VLQAASSCGHITWGQPFAVIEKKNTNINCFGEAGVDKVNDNTSLTLENGSAMAERKILMGVAWYRREEYTLLRALASDPEDMACTYEQWMVGANKLIADLEERGVAAQKVDVQVRELAAWCGQQSRPIDGKARSEYAAQKLRAEPGIS
jgi:hypothetical protein